MDIRFLAWGGYDLLGPSVGIGTAGPPTMESTLVDPPTRVISRELSPSMRGRPKTQPSARIIQSDLRPFPGPSNI